MWIVESDRRRCCLLRAEMPWSWLNTNGTKAKNRGCVTDDELNEGKSFISDYVSENVSSNLKSTFITLLDSENAEDVEWIARFPNHWKSFQPNASRGPFLEFLLTMAQDSRATKAMQQNGSSTQCLRHESWTRPNSCTVSPSKTRSLLLRSWGRRSGRRSRVKVYRQLKQPILIHENINSHYSRIEYGNCYHVQTLCTIQYHILYANMRKLTPVHLLIRSLALSLLSFSLSLSRFIGWKTRKANCLSNSDLPDFLSNNDWILLGYLFPRISLVVKWAIVFIWVPVKTAEEATTSTYKTSETNFFPTYMTSIFLLHFLRWFVSGACRALRSRGFGWQIFSGLLLGGYATGDWWHWWSGIIVVFLSNKIREGWCLCHGTRSGWCSWSGSRSSCCSWCILTLFDCIFVALRA